MANKRIPAAKRAAIIAALCEGVALNSACRMFKVGIHSILRIVEETGEACEDWHNRHFRNLDVKRLEVDEQWNYVHTHRERMSKEQKRQHPERGDCWLWAAIDPESKAIISWRTGKRGQGAARDFASDLASRVNGQVQITSDQLQGYQFAIKGAFGERADYAREHKVFRNIKVEGHEWMKYRVDPLVGVEREAVLGNPDLKTSTVCHMERFFLTMRQGNKRCARKTLAYSKDWGNHALTASIHMFVYNLVRKHETTKKTPAQMLGVVDHRWTLEDVVAMTDTYTATKEERAFEAAFASFQTTPRPKLAMEPTPKDQLLTPWYLDPESGGPNPLEKKPGISYGKP